jgi:hypothetical protein
MLRDRKARSRSQISGRLDGRLIHQHDGNFVLDRVDPVTLRASQTLRVLAIIKLVLANRTNQKLQQIFGNHGEYCTAWNHTIADCWFLIVDGKPPLSKAGR